MWGIAKYSCEMGWDNAPAEKQSPQGKWSQRQTSERGKKN